MGQQASKFCKVCQKHTLHEKQQLSNGTGCLLTVITCGVFLPFWLIYSILILPFRPFRCQTCGRGRLT